MILIQWCRRWGVAGVAAALMFNMCAASSIEIAQDASQRPRVSVSDDGFVALRMGNDNYGKLDVFLNLSGPESSVAWSTLKKAVQDYRDRVEFVFHVNLLPSDNPVAHTVSKAAYLISDRGFEEEAEAFLDQIFGNQGLFREGGSEDEIIENWVTASGGTFDVFNFASTAEDPTSDEKAARSLSTMAPPLIGMRPTAVYLDGILMTYLDESTDAGASTSFGRYLNGFIGWKANSLLLEKQNEKLLGEGGPA